MRGLKRALPYLVTWFAVVWALRRLDDADTWWHLASGRWIAQHRTVPSTDVLSYTVADHPWINLQWLYDLALYWLYQVGGPALLSVATALLFGLAFFLLLRNLRPCLGDLGSSLIALWIMWISAERFMTRPEVVTLVLLQVILWLLETARRGDSRRLWLLFPVMLVWVNTHSLFVIGPFVIGCYILDAMSGGLRFPPVGRRAGSSWDQQSRRRLLIAGTGSTLITILNPYLVEGMLFPVKLLSRINGSDELYKGIGEAIPPFSASAQLFSVVPYKVFILFATAIVVMAGALTVWHRGSAARRPEGEHGKPAKGPQGVDLAGLLVFAGLAYLSLLARRNMALFAMGAAPFIARCLRVLADRWPVRMRRGASVISAVATGGVLLVVSGAAWFVASNGLYLWNFEVHEFGAGVLESNFPIRAAAFVREAGLPGRLFCDLGSGGYLTWDSTIEDKVYVDGRGEVYNEFYLEYFKGLKNPVIWQDQADRAGIGTVLLDHRIFPHHPLILWLNAEPRWALVYLDEVVAVFVRVAGHEDLIAAARERFASTFYEQSDKLLERKPSWQWPMGQVIALANYAEALSLVGNLDRAIEFYAELLTYDLPRNLEARVRLTLAQRYIVRGDLDLAREQVEEAAKADPDNKDAGVLRSQLSR